MKTKLTLSIDDAVISKIKALSQKQSQSISSIVENHLKAFVDAHTNQSKTSKKEPTFTAQFRKNFRSQINLHLISMIKKNGINI